jgi:hypothetical protein
MYIPGKQVHDCGKFIYFYICTSKVVHAVPVQRPPGEKTIRARESQRNCAEFAAILSTSFEPMLNGPYETKKGRYRKA